MKIVQLINRTRSGFGGEETVAANTTAIMTQHGHEVFNAVRSSSEIGDSLPRKIAGAINGVYSLSGSSEMQRLVETERPDVVHAHNIYPQWSPSVFRMCRRLGVPTVLHVHCHYLTCPNWYHLRNGQVCTLCCEGKEYKCFTANCRGSYAESAAYFIRSYVARKLRLFVDNVNLFVTVSHFLKASLVSAGFPDERIAVLYNAVIEDVAAHDLTGSNNGAVDGGGYIGYCGRLSPEKGVHVLVEAARRCGLPVRIAGDGPERDNLERSAPSNVTFVGYLNRKAMGRFYRGCRFLVLPSLCFEAFGLVAAEAMSCGKPVIGSKIGGIPEIVRHDQTGLLFEPGDTEGLANRMSDLWTDTARRYRYGLAGQRAVRMECSADAYYAGLLSAYSRAIGIDADATEVNRVLPV